jgi:hypothetical protein
MKILVKKRALSKSVLIRKKAPLRKKSAREALGIIKEFGSSKSEVIRRLLNKGYTGMQLKKMGITPVVLKQMGFNLRMLVFLGYDEKSILVPINGFTASEYKKELALLGQQEKAASRANY